MGMVDTPQKQPKKQKTGGKLKRPKKRIGIRIDMTPMVDIAFLLLIFYMVTTVFSMPQSMEINLPPPDPEEKPLPVAKSKLLEVLVDSDGNIFWLHTPKGQEIDMELPEFIELNKVQKFLFQKNQDVPKLVTVLRIDPKCRYEVMVSIIDEIQVIERRFKQVDPSWSYRFSLQDMTQWEHQLMQQAKENMGMIDTEEGGEA